MKILKLGLIFTALTLFIIACTQTPSGNNAGNAKPAPNGTVTENKAPTNTNSPSNTASSSPAGDELASAKKIYTEKCASCHKENGEGGPVDIEGDKFKVPSYKSPGALKADDKDFTDTIINGDEKMPSFKKQLKPDEVAGLVKYIRKEFQGK
jgi:mono/diheme cytochrome c family protein